MSTTPGPSAAPAIPPPVDIAAALSKRVYGQPEAVREVSVALAKKLEKQFTGIAKPLQLESQQMQDSIVRGTAASLLRQHQTSVGRYGKAMIEDMERVMRVGFTAGLNQHQVISRLVQVGELAPRPEAAVAPPLREP